MNRVSGRMTATCGLVIASAIFAWRGVSAAPEAESIVDTDVVVWYAAHATHDVAHEEPGHFGHIVGPELRKVKW